MVCNADSNTYSNKLVDQEPVNMKRLEPWNRLTICA